MAQLADALALECAVAGAVRIDLENAGAVAKDKGVPLPMARTAAELYRLLDAQGRGSAEPTVLVELLAGTR